MKKICFVVPEFPSVSATFITNQIVSAKQQGFEVCVLTYKLGGFEQASQQELIEEYDILKDTIEIDYQIPKSKVKQVIVGLLYIFKYFKYWIKPSQTPIKHRILNWPFLIHFYKKFRYIDVFHIQFALGGVSIAEMKENGLLKGKLITTFHGHDAHFNNDKVLKHLQNRYKTLFSFSDYVTVNTQFLKSQVVSLGCDREKLRVIPMAIDVTFFKSKKPKKLSVKKIVKLISIGRLIEFKGFAYAIEAVKLLVDNNVNVHYTIIGEGKLLQPLQNQIKHLKLQDHVELVGKKSQIEIRELLEGHHIYLMSSVTNTKGRCETQGVVTAEAQAMGLPVVAFNSGGIPYTLIDGETGFLVPEKDVGAYAQAITNLIKFPDIYSQMSCQAREFSVENFSIELMIKRFKVLYTD